MGMGNHVENVSGMLEMDSSIIKFYADVEVQMISINNKSICKRTELVYVISVVKSNG